ncbi:hypothetical protein BDZ89DRAFT_1136332 [Hymenopellis radicata]|nr:hypothetical protein BDZ89DRAFT_1136332 [Hymenopellis radicata]
MLPKTVPHSAFLFCILCILCIALSLIIRPTFARSTFAPHDDFLGFIYVSCIMTASDYMLIFEPQRDFRKREKSIVETAPL